MGPPWYFSQEKLDLASHALEYLGTEPTEPFWMPVRQHILEELLGLSLASTKVTDGDVPGRELGWINGDRINGLFHLPFLMEFLLGL